jgi:hypothetical protein
VATAIPANVVVATPVFGFHTFTEQSAEPVNTRLPVHRPHQYKDSRQHTRARAYARAHGHTSACQLSPSGVKPPQHAASLWPLNTIMHVAFGAFHIHTEPSLQPAKNTGPRGCQQPHCCTQRSVTAHRHSTVNEVGSVLHVLDTDAAPQCLL